jgi:hypothetical protein
MILGRAIPSSDSKKDGAFKPWLKPELGRLYSIRTRPRPRRGMTQHKQDVETAAQPVDVAISPGAVQASDSMLSG